MPSWMIGKFFVDIHAKSFRDVSKANYSERQRTFVFYFLASEIVSKVPKSTDTAFENFPRESKIIQTKSIPSWELWATRAALTWAVFSLLFLFFAVYVINRKNYSFSRVVFFQCKTANSFYSKMNDSSRVRITVFSSSRFGVRVTARSKIFMIYP